MTAAAARLNLTQPAVTLQLRNLQHLADLPLLQRSNDGMILTAAGQEVLALFERVEAAITSCAASLDLMAGRSGGRVAIGAVSTAKYFVPFVMAAFSKLIPKVDISLSIGNREEIRQALRGYELDFAIIGPRAGRNRSGDPSDRRPSACHHRAQGHWLAKDSGLAANDLTHETFLTREQGSGTRLLMEQLFESTALQPAIGMEMSSNETIKQAVIAGLGIAFIPRTPSPPNWKTDGW